MNSSVSITNRRLTLEEARLVSDEIRRTPNIIGYLPNELLRLKTVLVAERDEEFLGLLAYIETDRFVDFKILLVREHFRGQGHGHLLFQHFQSLFENNTVPVYTITRNSSLIRQLEENQYTKIAPYKLPLVCLFHQLKMIFSLYRSREYLRKLIAYPRQKSFDYYLRPPITGQ